MYYTTLKYVPATIPTLLVLRMPNEDEVAMLV